MKSPFALGGLSSVVFTTIVHAATTCPAGQMNTGFGPNGSNGYVQMSPQAYPGNTSIDGPDSEGIAFDSSDNSYSLIVLGGNGSTGILGVVRLSSGGVPDRTYGGFGYVVPANQQDGSSPALTVDNQDRVVFVESGNGVLVASRFLPDGTADVTFGSSGSVSLPVAVSPNVSGATTQADGKILVGTRVNFPGGRPRQAAVVRLNADGSLDTAFGANGVAFLIPAGFSGIGRTSGVAALSDGRIVAIGTFYYDDGTIGPYAARILTDGSLDGSFGSGGISAFNFGVVTYGRRFGIQLDGKIVIAGGALDANNVSTFSVERVNTDGTLDAGFGTAGHASFGPGIAAATMALQANGRAIVAGTDLTTFQAAFARLTAKGQLDPTFGTNGIAEVLLPGTVGTETANIGVNSSGKVISMVGAQFTAGYVSVEAISLCH